MLCYYNATSSHNTGGYVVYPASPSHLAARSQPNRMFVLLLLVRVHEYEPHVLVEGLATGSKITVLGETLFPDI